MTEVTRRAIEKMVEKFGNSWVTDLQDKIEGVSYQTFKKYVVLEERTYEAFEEVSLEEVVNLLNSCAGDDCWGCDWEYRVIDGKPYEVFKYRQKRIVGIKF